MFKLDKDSYVKAAWCEGKECSEGGIGRLCSRIKKWLKP